MSTHVTAPAFWKDDEKGGSVVVADLPVFHAKLRKAGFGDGEALVVRVEREADALTEAQRRYYFAACVKPLSEYTGFSQPEMHLLIKGACMPPEKASITDLSKEEMRVFIDAIQQWAAETVGCVLEDPARHGAAA